MANYKAHFKTGLNQMEHVLDCKVASDLAVGQLCTYADGTLSAATSNAVSTSNYIVAQSDMTMEYGHVPVENRDYRYSPVVKASTSVNKKVAVFKVIDAADVYTTEIV